jgi:hypothetical protein
MKLKYRLIYLYKVAISIIPISRIKYKLILEENRKLKHRIKQLEHSPKFKVGEIIGPYEVVKILPFRYYSKLVVESNENGFKIKSDMEETRAYICIYEGEEVKRRESVLIDCLKLSSEIKNLKRQLDEFREIVLPGYFNDTNKGV